MIDQTASEHNLLPLKCQRNERHFIQERCVQTLRILAAAVRRDGIAHVLTRVRAIVQSALRRQQRTQIKVRRQLNFAVVRVEPLCSMET